MEPVPGAVEVTDGEVGVLVAVAAEAGEGSGEACGVDKERACMVCATTVAAVLACEGAAGKAQANMTAVNRSSAAKTLTQSESIFNIVLMVHRVNRNRDSSVLRGSMNDAP